MPNDINKAFEGLFYGLNAVNEGLIKKKNTDDLQELFSATKDRMLSLINPQGYQDMGGNPLSRGQVSEMGMENTQQQQPDMSGGLQALYENALQFSQYGDAGQPYLKSLQGLYEGYSDLNKQPKRDIREVNGQLVDITSGQPNVIYGEKKPEKTVYNQAFFEKQTLETVKNLTPDQIKEGYFYFPKEVQDELYKNTDISQYVDNVTNDGDFAPKTNLRKSKGPGSYKSPVVFGVSDKNKFASLKNLNERKWAGEEFTKEEESNYGVLQKDLGKKYNLNFEQLAKVTERLSNTNSIKEQDEVIASLDKGTYHNADENTSQEQINYDAERINEWVDYMQQIYDAEGYGEQWNIQKENFKAELKEYFNRGSITLKEYQSYLNSYK